MDASEVLPGSIVVGVDGSEQSTHALLWAAEQALLENRRLTLVHAAPPPLLAGTMGYPTSGLDLGGVITAARKEAEQLLAAALTLAREGRAGLEVDGVLTTTDPRTALLDLSEDAAMIVIGSRGRGPVSSLLLGSVSVSVSKHAACAVVVRRSAARDRVDRGILVGVDGTPRSTPAIDFAYRMASVRARPLTVLHCYWAPDLPGEAGAAAGADRVDEHALVSASIAGMQERYPDVEARVQLSRGFADQRLVAASLEHELVVIGHHPVTPLTDLVYGSVAPTVVEHSHGAVAVVPSLLPVGVTDGAGLA